jgi:non-ribosomal peptide synthetase component F
LPPLPVQYLDYTAWQLRATSSFERDLQYWSKGLANAPRELELPFRRIQQDGREAHTEAVALLVAPRILDNLKKIRLQRGCTLFMLLTAALSRVLHSYSRASEIVICTDVANRVDQTEHLIGPFLNQVLLRIDLSGNPDFLTVLDRVRQVTLDALRHQQAPFELVLERSRATRQPGRSPLSQIKLNLQNLPFGIGQESPLEPGNESVSVAPARAAPQPPLFDMTLFMSEESVGLRGLVVYNSSLFMASDMLQFARDIGAELCAVQDVETSTAEPDAFIQSPVEA